MRRGAAAAMRAGLPAVGAGLLLLVSGCGGAAPRTSSPASRPSWPSAAPATRSRAPARPASPARTSTSPSAARASTASTSPPSRASSPAGSSIPTSTRRSTPRPARRCRSCRPTSSTGGSSTTSPPTSAYAAGKRGEDSGRLGTVGVKRSNEVAKAEDGELAIPADPSGALAYKFGSAEAEAGHGHGRTPRTTRSIDHNIAVKGNGLDEQGRRRQGRRDLDRRGRPRRRRVHVLLLGAGPRAGRHGGQAHRQVSEAAVRACLRLAPVLLLRRRARTGSTARRP